MTRLRFLMTAALVLITIGLANAQMDVFGNSIPSKKKTVKPIPAHYNQTDGQGRKQGPWEKRYTDGSPLYKATFKDNKPVGELTRYYTGGVISARIVYDQQSLHGKAEFFDAEGNLASKGNYIGTKKDSTWTFYAVKKTINSTEDYVDGLKNGKTTIFFPGGQISEIIHWKDDQKHGPWLKFNENGTKLLVAQHQHGTLHGNYHYFYENGQKEIDATFKTGKEDGDWTFYLPDGKVDYVLKYKMGKLLNPEVLDAKREAMEKEYEKNKDKLKDPEKFINNPDQLLQSR